MLLLWLGRAFVFVAVEHRASSAFFASATWGFLLLASFAGWGSALNMALFPQQSADWGLRCAWGWAMASAIGSVLCSLSLARRGELIAVVAIGLLLLSVAVVRGYLAWSRRHDWRAERVAYAYRSFAAGVGAVSLLGITQYFASIRPFGINGNDDDICYFAFAREILDRGALTQPFSFRRLSVYGAKSLLDAFQLAIPVPVPHARLVDGGLAVLTVMALIVGHARASRWTTRAVVLLLLLLVVTMPDIRFNTATTMTGVVFFLGLYRTLTWRSLQETRGWRAALPVALLAAGACALRQNYIVPIAMWLLLAYGSPLLDAIRLRPLRLRSSAWIDAGCMLGLMVALLAPWWAMSQRYCDTFLFPLVKGNFNRAYPMLVPVTGFDRLRYIWSNVSYCLPVKAVPLFLIAGLTLRPHRRRAATTHFVVAAFVGIAALIIGVPDSDAENLARYYFGFAFAALVAIALSVADSAARTRESPRVRASDLTALMLVVVGIGVQTYGDRDDARKVYDAHLTTLQSEFRDPVSWDVTRSDPTYAALQEGVPAGAPIVVMVDEAYRFDFARNPIEILDIVGAISPPPGLPLFKGADVVADYLVALGYRYAIVVHPDAALSLYKRVAWVDRATNAAPIWRRTAPFYLAAFDVFDQLRATRAHLADAGSMTALDLTRRTP